MDVISFSCFDCLHIVFKNLQPEDLRVFMVVVRRASFAVAAQELGASPAYVSKRIRLLESELAVKLLHRTTRRVAVTEEGERVFQWAQRILDDIDHLVEEVSTTRSEPRGLLRVSSRLLLMSVWLEGGVAVMQQQVLAITWQGIGAVAYLALLSTLLGYGLWTQLLQRYPASTVAPLSLLVPVIGLLSAMLLLGEFPSGMQWLGTLGVLLGMVVNQFGGRLARR